MAVWSVGALTEGPSGFVNVTLPLGGIHPLDLILVSESGDVTRLIQSYEVDRSPQRSGFAYAGAGETTATTPPIQEGERVTSDYPVHWSASPASLLILTWAPGAEHVTLELTMDEEAFPTLTHASREVEVYRIMEGETGVRFGTDAARVHRGEVYPNPIRGPVIGWIQVMRSNAGEGSLRLISSGEHPAFPLGLPFDASCPGAFDLSRVYFTAGADSRLELDYVGEGKTTIVALFAPLPAGLLSTDLWQVIETPWDVCGERGLPPFALG